MKERAFQFFIDAGKEHIEVRVSPNFGQRWSCRIGHWVATLLAGERPAGSDCCAETLTGAKILGLKKAYLHYVSPPDHELMRLAEMEWPVILIE